MSNKVNQPSTMSVSLVVPCYNEADRLNSLFTDIKKFDQNWKGECEYIFVNDGSTDGTVDYLNRMVEKSSFSSRCSVVDLTNNVGKGGALKAGVELAKLDFVLTIDADNAVSPNELFKWLKKIGNKGFSDQKIYIASRELDESNVKITAFRRFTGLIFNSVIQSVTSINFKDSQCGFKLYPRKVAEYLFSNLTTKGWAHDVELLDRAIDNNISIEILPIDWNDVDGSKISVFSDSFRMFIQALFIGIKGKFNHFFVTPFKGAYGPTDKEGIYRFLFALTFILALFVMPMLSGDYGITGDEEVQKNYGDKALAYFESFGEDKSCLEYKNLYHYGAFFEVTTSFVNKYIFPSVDPYDVRHFINSLFGVFLLLFTGRLAFRVSNSWKVAFWAILFCFLFPRIFGHSMNNPKDIPFATFFTLGMMYIVSMYKEFPNISLKTIIGFIIALGIAMGIRIGAVLLIPYLGLFALVAIFVAHRNNLMTMKTWGKITVSGLVMVIGGYALGVIFWPYAIESPLTNPLKTFGEMSSFSVGIRMLYNDFHHWSDNLPWFYLPHWILMSSTIVVLLGLPMYFLGFLKEGLKTKLLVGLLLFTFVFPPVYAILTDASYYDGIRHFMFIIPIMIVLSAWGWIMLQEMMSEKIGKSVEFVMAGLCILPLIWMVKSHPNQYIYFNEIFGGASENYGYNETDYWMNSLKETTDWFLENEYPKIKDKETIYISTNAYFPIAHYMKTQTDNVKVRYTSYVNRTKVESDYEIFFSRFVNKDLLKNGFFPPAEVLFVNKQGNAILSHLSKRLNSSLEKAGTEALKKSQYGKADSLFQLALVNNENDEKVLEQLSFTYLQAAQYQKFEKTMEKLDKFTTTDPILCFYKGLFHLKKQDAPNALKWFSLAADYNYKLSSANYYVASLNAQDGNWEKVFKAIIDFENGSGNIAAAYDLGIKAADKLGERAYSLFFKAKKAAIEKDYNNVLGLLKRALKLDPKLKRAQQMLDAYEKAMKAQK